MKFISLATWRDLTDGHLYHEGEPFPFDGREIAPGRIAELGNAHNRAGLALIRADEAPDEVTEAPKAEAPEKAPEGRKTAAKTAKTAPKKRTTKK